MLGSRNATRIDFAWAVLIAVGLAIALCLAGCQTAGENMSSAQGASLSGSTSASPSPSPSVESSPSSSAGSSTEAKETPSSSSSSKPQKAKLKTNPRIAVCCLEKRASTDVRRWMKRCGLKVTWVGTLNIDLNDYDALILPGGSNITPSVYGAEKAPETYGCNLENDELQVGMARMFIDAGKPILGVCRGQQILNVTFGGTLEQHIPGWHKGFRVANIQEGTFLYDLFGDSEDVYHSHHQCIDVLGEGLYATEWDADDGRIEGIEHESLPVYGIQWHPERMKERGVAVGKLFIEKCLELKSEREAQAADAQEAEAAEAEAA